MKSAKTALMRLWLMVVLCAMVLTACTQNQPQNQPAEEENTPAQEEPATQTPETPAEEPQEEYTEPLQDGYNQVTFYWSYPGTYEKCDMWIWWGDVAGKGYLFHECEYGAKVVVNVPEGIDEIGFIVRRDCSEPGGSSWGSATKDYESDRFATLTGRETFIYLKHGEAEQYLSNDGGKTLYMDKKFTLVGLADQNKLRYSVTPMTTITDLSQVKVYEGDREIAVAGVSSLGKEAASGYIETAEPLDITKT